MRRIRASIHKPEFCVYVCVFILGERTRQAKFHWQRVREKRNLDEIARITWKLIASVASLCIHTFVHEQ